jgi:hypothetical protein
MQRWTAAHALPHAPQFIGSALVSRHAAPQSIMPIGHAHTPATQLCMGAQAVPHAPQCIESVCKSVQTCVPSDALQIWRGALHVSAHAALSQIIPDGHALPHEPQFIGSLRVSTQLPAHSVCVAIHRGTSTVGVSCGVTWSAPSPVDASLAPSRRPASRTSATTAQAASIEPKATSAATGTPRRAGARIHREYPMRSPTSAAGAKGTMHRCR